MVWVCTTFMDKLLHYWYYELRLSVELLEDDEQHLVKYFFKLIRVLSHITPEEVLVPWV